MMEIINTELSKDYSKAIQGIAVLFMLLLHLFCRYDNLPYYTSLYIKEIPVLYYIGLWGDQCVALFCFCAGYASYLQQEKVESTEYRKCTRKRLYNLLKRFWIILFLFSSISVVIGNKAMMPGSAKEFLGNLSLVRMTYNGAWWFLTTYVLLSVFSKIFYRFVKNRNSIMVIGLFGVLYFVAYLVRFNIIYVSPMNIILDWIVKEAALLGTSMLPYIVGMSFYKYKLISFLHGKVQIKSKLLRCIISGAVFCMCIIIHGLIESLIVAPFFALITVCVISLWSNEEIRVLKYIGDHSTNIWLVHMFFYSAVFEGFVFVFKYPILVFVSMIFCCLVSSYIINWIYMYIGKCEFIILKKLNCRDRNLA